MAELTVVPYAEHEDHDSIKRARTVQTIKTQIGEVQLRKARKRPTRYFLFLDGYASAGFANASSMTKRAQEFAEAVKAMAVTVLVLSPMLMETVEVRFSGHSDDLVYVQGCRGADEFEADENDFAVFLLTGDGGSMRVIAQYDAKGCWSFAISRAAEDVPVPRWMSYVDAPGKGYSADLVIEAPKGALVAKVAS